MIQWFIYYFNWFVAVGYENMCEDPKINPLMAIVYFCGRFRIPLVSIAGSLRDRELACSASDRQGSNFESCVWRTVSSQLSHHPQEVLLAQFSLYVHKGGLKPDSFHFSFQDPAEENWLPVGPLIFAIYEKHTSEFMRAICVISDTSLGPLRKISILKSKCLLFVCELNEIDDEIHLLLHCNAMNSERKILFNSNRNYQYTADKWNVSTNYDI